MWMLLLARKIYSDEVQRSIKQGVRFCMHINFGHVDTVGAGACNCHWVDDILFGVCITHGHQQFSCFGFKNSFDGLITST